MYFKNPLILCFIFTFLFSAFPISAFSASTFVGKITSIEGTSNIVRWEGGDAVVAKKNMALFVKDHVKSEKNSKLTITLRDGSKVYVGGGSSVKVSAFVLDKKKQKRKTVFSLLRGKARFVVMKILKTTSRGLKIPWKNASFNVVTPSAVVGVKGTDFGVSYSKKSGTSVDMFKGRARIRGRRADGRPTKKSVTLTNNTSTKVKSGFHPRKPVSLKKDAKTEYIKDTATKEDTKEAKTIKDETSEKNVKTTVVDETKTDSSTDGTKDDTTKDDTTKDDTTKDDSTKDGTKDGDSTDTLFDSADGLGDSHLENPPPKIGTEPYAS